MNYDRIIPHIRWAAMKSFDVTSCDCKVLLFHFADMSDSNKVEVVAN